MNAVLDFIRGAAPWVPMGLLLVIFAVRSAAKDKKAGYDFREYNIIEEMHNCRLPVFFAHGTGDHFVPCVSGKKTINISETIFEHFINNETVEYKNQMEVEQHEKNDDSSSDCRRCRCRRHCGSHYPKKQNKRLIPNKLF